MRIAMRRRSPDHQLARAVSILLAAALTVGIGLESAAHDKDGRVVRVMTQNVYEGTNFEELGAATTPAEFVAAVTATFQGIAATKPAERAADIAKEIAQHK